MAVLDYVLLGIVALVLFGAVLLWRYTRKKGGCGGNCAGCQCDCNHRK